MRSISCYLNNFGPKAHTTKVWCFVGMYSIPFSIFKLERLEIFSLKCCVSLCKPVVARLWLYRFLFPTAINSSPAGGQSAVCSTTPAQPDLCLALLRSDAANRKMTSIVCSKAICESKKSLKHFRILWGVRNSTCSEAN